jgi:hypothetical protein
VVLFDKIIAAFKVRGKHVELGRTSHDKTMDDFVRCTKLPENIEVCFIDDLYHSGMADDNVYYINVKPYKYQMRIENMITRYMNSHLGNKIKNKEHFTSVMTDDFKRYKYRIHDKTQKEQEIDEIIGKRMLQHLKQFFYEKTNHTFKKKKRTTKNKTFKRDK